MSNVSQLKITDTTKHSWLISVRYGTCPLLEVFTFTGTQLAALKVGIALRSKAGAHTFIGMRAVDTDPL